jgi:hypothetical protein
MKNLAAALAFSLLAGTALAQTPKPPVSGEPETVYSQAQRQKDVSAARWIVDDLLRQSFSIDNVYARWKLPVCPHVYGLRPLAAWQIEQRIRAVAAMVGAPLDRDDPCIPNIGIVFTPDPQASLNSIANKAPMLVQGGNQRLTVRYPVQAWYASFAVSNNGHRMIDIPWELMTPPLDGPPSMLAVDSTRLSTGIHSEMAAATVLVDSKAVTGRTTAELADYLAMMVLGQAGQYGKCMDTASITNLMLDCGPDNTIHALSHIDIALLKGLYQMPLEPELLQKPRLLAIVRRLLEADGTPP